VVSFSRQTSTEVLTSRMMSMGTVARNPVRCRIDGLEKKKWTGTIYEIRANKKGDPKANIQNSQEHPKRNFTGTNIRGIRGRAEKESEKRGEEVRKAFDRQQRERKKKKKNHWTTF